LSESIPANGQTISGDWGVRRIGFISKVIANEPKSPRQLVVLLGEKITTTSVISQEISTILTKLIAGDEIPDDVR
jgi:hypothetical protein